MKYEDFEKAAELLDNIRSDWHDTINLDKLDLKDPDNCVLGQLFGNFTSAPQILKDEYPFGMMLSQKDDSSKYNKYWIELINQRKSIKETEYKNLYAEYKNGRYVFNIKTLKEIRKMSRDRQLEYYEQLAIWHGPEDEREDYYTQVKKSSAIYTDVEQIVNRGINGKITENCKNSEYCVNLITELVAYLRQK